MSGVVECFNRRITTLDQPDPGSPQGGSRDQA